jgi:hypothetical protein
MPVMLWPFSAAYLSVQQPSLWVLIAATQARLMQESENWVTVADRQSIEMDSAIAVKAGRSVQRRR